MDVMFTQMNVKRGIKMFKKGAVAAMIKKWVQLDRITVDGKLVAIPIDPNLLASQDKKLALKAVHQTKEKEEMTLKERLVQMVANKNSI